METFMKIKNLFGIAALVALLPVAVQAQEVVLKVAHFVPPTAPGHTKFISPWCDKVAAESAGRIKCQIYPAMQLGGTPQQLLSQVRDGVADIAWTLPGYTPGRFPITEVFELPFMTREQESSSRALWDFVQKNTLNSEFSGLQPLATWVPGSYTLHLRAAQPKVMADLKDMKIRSSSRLTTRLLAVLGASPVGMPVTQMPEALSKGVIEATMLPWEVVPAMKVHELTKYSAEFAGDHTLSTTTMVFVMNKKKYDGLPADLKKIIDANSGRETSAWVSAQLKSADAGGRAATAKNGNTIYQIPAEETAKWKTVAKAVNDEWVKEVAAKGVDGNKLIAEATSLVDQYATKK
jgi:TRAP-type C4-dicarboxylate transport system substrate-binding protein